MQNNGRLGYTSGVWAIILPTLGSRWTLNPDARPAAQGLGLRVLKYPSSGAQPQAVGLGARTGLKSPLNFHSGI